MTTRLYAGRSFWAGLGRLYMYTAPRTRLVPAANCPVTAKPQRKTLTTHETMIARDVANPGEF